MKNRTDKRVAIVAALALAAVALMTAGAGVSAPVKKAPPPNPIAGLVNSLRSLSSSAREQKLYTGAKAEGTLKWYTTLSSTIGPAVVKAFEAKYPGVKVDMYRASSEDVTARMYQEASAGTSGADVVETNGTELFFMQHHGDIVVPYRGSPYAKAIPKAYQFDAFTGDRIEAFIVAWNTNKVKSGEEPHGGWQALADPKWAGKLAIEPGDIDWFAAVYGTLEKTQYRYIRPVPRTAKAKAAALKKIDARLDAMFAGVAQNSQIVSGHTTLATLLAAGQFSVCVTCHAQSIEALIKKNAPLAFKPFAAPIVIRAQGEGIVYRLQHPNAALLFYDWLLRPDGGQKALLDGGANPARPDMADPDLKGSVRFALNLRPIVAHWKFWSNKYDRLMQLAKG
jgi:iron(III) transport system substrate-binding protein